MQNNQKQVYEEIQDDQNNQSSNNFNQSNQAQDQNHQNNTNNQTLILNSKFQENYPYDHQTSQQQQTNLLTTQQPLPKLDQQDLGKYAHFEEDNQDGQNIKISITKTQKMGGVISSYIVYIIQGVDKKGTFCVPRRFNQFFQMRAAMVNRWPGCFIPSVPAKSIMGKNDDDIVKKRLRYLNEFVKKMAKLPHLFYGQEFQTLLRAQQKDISQLFAKWPTLTSQAIINKYRVNFSDLAGKQLNYETNQKIKQFLQFIKKNQAQLQKDRQNMKKLALANDKLIGCYGQFFTNLTQNYEKSCLLQYCNQKQSDTLYLNQSEAKLQQHQTLVKQALKTNPYWILYDAIRQQQRDGLAFIQALQAKNKYENKKNSIDIKISTNQKSVAQLAMGKKPIFSGSKTTTQQMKYKLQVQIEQLKRQKQNVLIIIDIVTALIAYIQIQRYKQQKKKFYLKALGRISRSQINQIQNLAEIWTALGESANQKTKAEH